MLATLDELILRCLDKNSRLHIQEAVRCYEAGAYRSAIVASYISVCFDLIEKLRSLAATGDLEAKKNVTELDKLQQKLVQNDPAAIPGLLKFERELPTLFRDKFEFFGSIEYDDILRLVQDRNRCAHPTFLHSDEPYRPSPEVARLHIRNALDLVLTQEVRQGRAALQSLSDLINSQYFPGDPEDIRSRLDLSPLQKPRDALITSFLNEVLFGIASKESSYFKNIKALKCAEALLVMHAAIAFPRFCIIVDKLLLSPDAMAVRYGSLAALRSPEVANTLSEPAKTVLQAYIKGPSGIQRASALQRGLAIGWLAPFAAREIRELSVDEIQKVKLPPAPEIVDRAIRLLDAAIQSRKIIKTMEELETFFEYFSLDQIETLLLSAKETYPDPANSFGFKSLVQRLATETSYDFREIEALLEKLEMERPQWSEWDSISDPENAAK